MTAIIDTRPYKVVADGLFRVYPDGSIYKRKPSRPTEWVLCTQTLHTFVKNAHYRYVTIAIDKKQVRFMVHRLFAEAFVYNDDPVNKMIVLARDDDKTNINVSNLYWATKQQMIEYRVDKKRQRIQSKQRPCIRCKKVNASYFGRQACTKCHEIITQQHVRLTDIRRMYHSVDVSQLNKTTRQYFDLYWHGFTYSQIAELYGKKTDHIAYRFRQIRQQFKI